MKRLVGVLVLIVPAGLANPLAARAETLVVPWSGFDTAGPNVDFGASVGRTLAGIVGVDVEFSDSPGFFGEGLDSHVLTTMGNVTVALPFDGAHAAGLRPYLTAGIGLIRASLDAPASGYSIVNNDLGANVGGGVLAFLGAHVGVRADVRHVRSLEDDGSSRGQFDLRPLHFWRTSFGLVLR